MLSLLLLLALGLWASATSIPRQTTPCTFSMTAVGEPNGTIVEDTIGENRIGGGFPQGIYHINNHSLFDGLNHNCLILPETFQFQCTQGAGGATNFTLANDGNLVHDASEKWYACPSAGPGNDGSYNIFSDALQTPLGCELVTLRTGGFGCSALGRPSSPSVPTATATGSPVASTASPSAACPTDISAGTFQFPHLIVPTSPQVPDYAFGNSFKASISPVNTTLFNFDIPVDPPYTGTCSLLFLFPYGTDLAPSAGTYNFTGIEEEVDEKGGLDFALLSGIANSATTFNSTPAVATDYGKTEILPGNNYTIATFPCHRSGTPVTYSVSSVNNVGLEYFQDDAPSPIGVYIVPCI